MSLELKIMDCQSCAQCCVNEAVLVSKEEIAKIVAMERIEPDEFIEQRFIQGQLTEGHYPVIMQQENGDCYFLTRDDDRFSCEIYYTRPKICENYPMDEGQLEWCRENSPPISE